MASIVLSKIRSIESSEKAASFENSLYIGRAREVNEFSPVNLAIFLLEARA